MNRKALSSRICLAVDLGATSGRVIAGAYKEGRLKLEELHRFPTASARLPSGDHWDILGLYRSILDGLGQAARKYGDRILSVGVDTWGVDYALLDEHGRLLGDPYQYRDSRTDGAEAAIAKLVSQETIYRETGIQFMFFNTLNQLFAEKQACPMRLEAAADLLFLPDLLSYWLSGVKVQERSISSTSQMWNPQTEDWSAPIVDSIGLPRSLFRKAADPGQKLAPLLPHLQEETGLGPIEVIAVAGHDTASAVCGTPLTADAPCFLSSGTWSIMGMELPEPVINERSLAEGFSNEAGVEGSTRFLKNICGMWLIEELRRQWASEGKDPTYELLLELIAEATPFTALIDPDDPRFAAPGKMAERIAGFCQETNQPVPKNMGQLARVALESLACKYRIVFDSLQELAGREFASLRIVGGGCQNPFLNQCSANALGKPVIAGPVEATSIGNIVMQLKGVGEIPDVAAGRALAERSFESERFDPIDAQSWLEPVARVRSFLARAK